MILLMKNKRVRFGHFDSAISTLCSDSEDKVENESDSDIETETEQEEVSTKSDALVGPIGDQRRQTLPVFMSPDSEVNLLYILKKNIGKDLTKVSGHFKIKSCQTVDLKRCQCPFQSISPFRPFNESPKS